MVILLLKFIICQDIIFSSCGFGIVVEVFSVASSETASAFDCGTCCWDLPHFYLDILEAVLLELIMRARTVFFKEARR